MTALPVPARRSRIASHSSLLTFLAVAAVVLLGVQAFVAEPFRIPTASMAPTLRAGDHVVVESWRSASGTRTGARSPCSASPAPATWC